MRRDRRVERILDGGAAVLGERGYHGVTMRDLAAASGTSVGNLYRYLDGTADLLYQVEMRILKAAVASAQAALAGRGAARERLRAFVTDHIRRIQARPFEAVVLRGDAGPLRKEKARHVEAERKRYHVLVRAAIEEAVRRPGGRGSGTVLATILLGAADRVAEEAPRTRSSATPDALAARVLAVFFDGAVRRGR
jgi:AcrR family transcriptional regulator